MSILDVRLSSRAGDRLSEHLVDHHQGQVPGFVRRGVEVHDGSHELELELEPGAVRKLITAEISERSSVATVAA